MKIERNIPIPPIHGWGNPFPIMDVGDSIFFDTQKNSDRNTLLARAKKAMPGAKFTTRKMDGGFRIWRTE